MHAQKMAFPRVVSQLIVNKHLGTYDMDVPMLINRISGNQRGAKGAVLHTHPH
jgi:hypothetical protein